jgi:D-alanyl-D-alanine carboxypeptidase/D-alanyl-D-alanine-endopeptidase (penicillin-binding protein 4)
VGRHGRDTSAGTRRRWPLFAAVGLVLVLGAGAAVVATQPKLQRRLGLAGVSVTAPDAVPPTLRLAPLAADAPTPTGSGVTAALEKPAAAKELGTLTGVVLDPATDKVLWSRNPTKALTPGSTGKVLTAAGVLLTLDPTMRLTTRVVAGPTPDSVVLVGGGDPTLSVLPAGKESVYPGAAKLDDLAKAVKAAHPAPIRTVTVDVSRYSGPGMAPGWLSEDIAAGYFTPIGPLILDGGRSKPAEIDPPRTATPAVDAGKELAERLGAEPSSVKTATAPTGAAVLGEVSSPPIIDLVQNALRISDNVLAETLLREVAVAKGAEPSFAGGARAVADALTAAGLKLGDTKMVDGSGLSTEDRVSATLLGQVMAAAAEPTRPATSDGAADGGAAAGGASPDRAARLRPLLGGLPVAGGDGTLDDRFLAGASAPGKGYVRAKTGTLTGVSSLAGQVVDADGRVLVFAWLSNGTSPADSRPKLDALAAALRACGCR